MLIFSRVPRRTTGLGRCCSLRVLEANFNSLTAISGLEACTHLVHLSVAHNSIARMSGLRAQRRLETLDLSHNNIEAGVCNRLRLPPTLYD